MGRVGLVSPSGFAAWGPRAGASGARLAGEGCSCWCPHLFVSRTVPRPGLALRQHGAPPARLPPLPGRSTVREERGAEAQPGPGAGPARRTRSGRTPAVQAAGTRGAPCSPGQLGWGRRPRAIRWEAAQDLGARCRVPVQQPRCHPRHVLGVGPTPGRAWDWAGWAATWDRRPCEGTPGHGVPPDTVTQQGRKTVGRLAESHGGVWRGPGPGCAGSPDRGARGPGERGARGPWSGVRGALERGARGPGAGAAPGEEPAQDFAGWGGRPHSSLLVGLVGLGLPPRGLAYPGEGAVSGKLVTVTACPPHPDTSPQASLRPFPRPPGGWACPAQAPGQGVHAASALPAA